MRSRRKIIMQKAASDYNYIYQYFNESLQHLEGQVMNHELKYTISALLISRYQSLVASGYLPNLSSDMSWAHETSKRIMQNAGPSYINESMMSRILSTLPNYYPLKEIQNFVAQNASISLSSWEILSIISSSDKDLAVYLTDPKWYIREFAQHWSKFLEDQG